MNPNLLNQFSFLKQLLVFSIFLLSSSQIFAQPSRDNCSGATNLTSGTSCSNTGASLNGATASTGFPAGCASAGIHYDIWYRFTAVAASHTVAISNRGTNFTNPELQIFSGTCAALVSLACGTTTVTATGLTVGNIYYIRISNVGAVVNNQGGFNICVTNPPPAPSNDDCGAATTLTSASACNTVTANLRYATSAGPAGACGTGVNATNTYDVWFRFQATATNQTVTISNLGANLSATSTYFEILSGTCGSLTSLGCQQVSATNGRRTTSGLTIGTFYYVRVYVLLSPTATATASWNFNICVQQPPANDECAGAIALTPALTCTNTAGTLDLATTNGTVPLGCFAAGTYYDVWYRFVATAALQHTVTISSLGALFTAPRIQIYGGNCAGLTPIIGACAVGTTLTQAGLISGTTYYVRIANFNVNPSGTGTAANFNICITRTVSPPANDLCNGAISLTSNTTCSNILGTLINATATASLPACGNNGSSDVWYSFIAQTNYPVITLNNIGNDLLIAGPRIQLFSGTCAGVLTSLACQTVAASPTSLNTASTPGGVGLSVGVTYFIRITTNTSMAPPTGGTWTFNICVTDPIGAAVDYGKSYINVTNNTGGGTINPGDVLEIRSTFVVNRAGSPLALRSVDSLAFYDTLSAGKGLAYVPGSIALKTNEGKLYKSYTDAFDITDAGWYRTTGAGTDTTLQINMGLNASYRARGKLRSNSKPSNFGNTCIIMATYRVTVNAPYGTMIDFGGGTFRYRDSATGVFYNINFPKDSLMVYSSPGSCPDATSPINVIGDEVNGTFGVPAASAGSQNRGTSANTDYAYKPFSTNGPDDYFYGVANNSSANFTVIQTVPKNNASPSRVFNVWDIAGDHTGAVNTGTTSKGNVPCNPGLPISVTNPCGYMMVINSAYRTDVAFKFNVSGACTETYYEISAWFKNICYKCGCDSNGVSANGAGYLPSGPGDSAGIRPNIAFEINGIDYFTTGDLPYMGLGGTQSGSDTLNRWVKRSFVYKTGLTESDFVMTLRNNAPGGGGNDWAIDDISIKTCYPNMAYSPSANPSVCAGNSLTITDTVRSYYNVYIYYKWQRSIDAGLNWIDLAGSSGVASTVWNGSIYEYVNSYTLSPSYTNPSNNGDLYRMVVATTASNLNGSCNYSDIAPVTLSILNNCIDIDDDNDGIPDYVEFDNPLALLDLNGNGIPNWNDIAYPGYADNNVDNVNDNFDWGADRDNDGVLNFNDPGFWVTWVDINGDAVNDAADKDLDGIPNQYDLDSDNDGIPDVVESYGVDTNGDGIIDNYTDTDNDGFSQNVDGNSTGVTGSVSGLGAQDLDGDFVPNYLDTDSDNDGIQDVIEALGNDANNDGKIDGYDDADGDGLSDAVDGDVGNNSFAENESNSLLRTGPDTSPVNGRADDYPYKNFDNDKRANPYDLDSDMDGIVDVIEAGFTDANFNGFVDGIVGADGWNIAINALPSLNLLNSDGIGNPNYLDIDADGDGIPDNVEGQTTFGYRFPVYLDTDSDGLDNAYDLAPFAATFGGAGIFLADKDGDNIPDYIDLDTDSDGALDIIEGNDFNLNSIRDDNVTPTGLDTDGDGLDNRFDSLNSVTNIRGTSYRMGTGGSLTGDPAPGTRAPVQKTILAQSERDWRYVTYVLPLQYLKLSGEESKNNVSLNWGIISTMALNVFEIERSTDNVYFQKIASQSADMPLDQMKHFSAVDNISSINSEVIFYRLKVIAKNGQQAYSNVVFIRRSNIKIPVTIHPNPASNITAVRFYSEKDTDVTISIKDITGRLVYTQKLKAFKGNNSLPLTGLSKFSNGVYNVQLLIDNDLFTSKLIIQN